MQRARRTAILVGLLALPACGTLLGSSDDASPPGATTPRSDDDDAGDGDGDTTVVVGDDDQSDDAGAADADSGDPIDAGVDAPDPACNGALACTRYVFVTSMTYPADFGANGADALCTSLADGPSSVVKGRQWNAWISFGGPAETHARDRIVAGTGPYRRVDGVEIASSWLELVDPGTPLAAPILYDETMTARPNEAVWSGTTAMGLHVTTDCNGWSSTDSGGGKSGDTSATGGGWTEAGDTPCGLTARLYCFER